MKHFIGVSIYDNPTVRSFAIEWFKNHDDRMPRCTCGAREPETINNVLHPKECPMHEFALEGWAYAVDRWLEMEREG